MLKIILATKNRGKIEEMESMIRKNLGFPVQIYSLLDYPDIPDIHEDGQTFAENARKKALEVARYTGIIAIADDSGLEVDALQGKPGIYSARFAGEGATDRENIRRLLDMLADVPFDKRTGRFKCVIAIATPDGRVKTVTGECKGIISTEERGAEGFGYDPVFVVPSYGKTFAELGREVKNEISHRAVAVRKACKLLPRMEEVRGKKQGMAIS